MALLWVVPGLCYLNLGAWFRAQSFAEPLIVFGLAIVSLRLFDGVRLVGGEVMLVVFVVYRLVHEAVMDGLHTWTVLPALESVMLYLIIRGVCEKIQNHPGKWRWMSSLTLWLHIVFCLVHTARGGEIADMFFPNKSVYGYLLVGQIIMYWHCRPKWNSCAGWQRLLYLVPAMLAMVLVFYTGSRTAFLGIVLVLMYEIYHRVRLPANCRWMLVLLIIPFLAGLYQWRRAAADGRLLIYEISCRAWMKNFLSGAGAGKFPATYNLEQAKYFQEKGLDNADTVLASPAQFAFNDWLQLAVEEGVCGLLLFISGWILLLRKVERVQVYSCVSMHLVLVGLAASAFSYPMEVFPLKIWMLTTLAFLSIRSADLKPTIPTSRMISRLGIFIGSSVLNVLYGVAAFGFLLALAQRVFVYKAGVSLESGNIGEARQWLCRSSFLPETEINPDKPALFYDVGNIEAAGSYLTLHHLNYYNDRTCRLSARIHLRQGDTLHAIVDYIMAVHMAPHQLRDRYALACLYFQKKRWNDALYWSNSVLNAPVKILSGHVTYLRSAAAALIAKLNEKLKVKLNEVGSGPK